MKHITMAIDEETLAAGRACAERARTVFTGLFPVDFDNGLPWYAWVDHDGVSQDLQVRWSQTPARPSGSMLSYTVDLLAILGSSDVYAGFTSGTGPASGSTTFCPGTSSTASSLTVQDQAPWFRSRRPVCSPSRDSEPSSRSPVASATRLCLRTLEPGTRACLLTMRVVTTRAGDADARRPRARR